MENHVLVVLAVGALSWVVVLLASLPPGLIRIEIGLLAAAAAALLGLVRKRGGKEEGDGRRSAVAGEAASK